MTITVGSTPVQAIYVGSTPVQEVYVGSTKIWPTAPAEQWTRWADGSTIYCTRVRNPDPATGSWAVYYEDHNPTFSLVREVEYDQSGNVSVIRFLNNVGTEISATFESVEE